MSVLLILLSLLKLSTQSYSINTTEVKNELQSISNYMKEHSDQRSVVHFNDLSSIFFNRTELISDFLKSVNISKCDDGRHGSTYVKRHIFDSLVVNHNLPVSHWFEYKNVFDKRYHSHKQEITAIKKWTSNLKHVAEHNQRYLEGKHSYSLHLNNLADLSSTDYLRNVLKLIDTVPLHDPREDFLRTAFHKHSHRKTPRRVDWRSQGFRPRREQQYNCGACYAFAVAHALQAQLYKKHRRWSELSAQQIVDCSAVDGNFGCEGGSLRAALRYVVREGLHFEKNYPYVGWNGVCLANPWYPRVKPRRWSLIEQGDEDAIERAVAHIGPLAVAVNASPKTFQLYRSGIYDDPFCTSWVMNHAMLLVGYTPKYWVLLNWWGPHWGENGYMRIRRGHNKCGVANMAAYIEL